MFQVLIVVVGVCLGILAAESRVPYIRWVPLASEFILGMVTIALMLKFSSPQTGLVDGLIFCFSVVVASSLYAGVLWKRVGIDPTLSYWGWVRRDFTNPGYLRRSQRESLSQPDVENQHSHG